MALALTTHHAAGGCSTKQMTLATATFPSYRKATRREAFLSKMDWLVPWATLCALMKPVYPKAGNCRPPIGVDSRTKLIQSVVATAANVAECSILPDLLHGDKNGVWVDQAYRGQRAAIRDVEQQAQE